MLLLTRQLDCKTYIEELCKKKHVRTRQLLTRQHVRKNATVLGNSLLDNKIRLNQKNLLIPTNKIRLNKINQEKGASTWL